VPVELLAVIVTLKVPPLVFVPVIAPVREFKMSPGGRLLALKLVATPVA
jgi:hypothetical protein